jgi:hypothetical protein
MRSALLADCAWSELEPVGEGSQTKHGQESDGAWMNIRLTQSTIVDESVNTTRLIVTDSLVLARSLDMVDNEDRHHFLLMLQFHPSCSSSAVTKIGGSSGDTGAALTPFCGENFRLME